MAVPNSGRFAAMTIEQHYRQAKADNVGAVVVALLAVTAYGGDKSLRFHGAVTIKADDVALATYDIASDTSGALANFRDVDAVVKVVASIIPDPAGSYPVQINVGSILDKAPATDLIKAATAKKVRITAQKAKVETKIAAHDAQLALMVGWESGNSLQALKKGETLAQKAVLVALVASIEAEVTRLTGLGG